GLQFQSASYSQFEGKTIDDGSITFYLHHNDCCGPRNTAGSFPNPTFESDLMQEKVSLNLKTNSTAFLFNYGLTDRWDVGAAIPIVHVSVDARIDSTIQYLDFPPNPRVHVFPNGTLQQTVTASGDKTGLGDVVIRSKYRLWKTQGGGFAVGADVR